MIPAGTLAPSVWAELQQLEETYDFVGDDPRHPVMDRASDLFGTLSAPKVRPPAPVPERLKEAAPSPPKVEEAPQARIVGVPAPQVEKEASPQPPAPEPRRPGKGGAEHTYLQELVKRWAEERGFRAMIEEQIPCGREIIDVALYRGETRIACEISVTTPLDYEGRERGKVPRGQFRPCHRYTP